MTKYKITVDREKCIGCGACVGVCPDCFEMDEGKAKPKKEVCEKDCCKEAAGVCPVDAIKIEKIKK